MKSKTTNKFWKCYRELPAGIKKQAKETYSTFQNNPDYPGLNFKKVHNKLPIFSVRISRDYRALGIKQENTIIWYWIGSHNDYERILKK
ncbi:MAG: hypothetical protein ACLFQM_11880 [Fidelibacterota bacterium]